MNFVLSWIAALASGPVIKAILSRALVALGIGFVSYSGFNAVLDLVISKVQEGVSGLPATALALITIGGFPNALSIVLSAMAAKLVIRGLTASGVLTKMQPVGGSTLIS